MEVLEQNYYLNEDQYATLKQQWQVLAKERTITRADIVLYNVLRGKDIKRGFVEKQTNIQGNSGWFAFKVAKVEAKVLIKKGFTQRFGFEAPETLDGLICD
jgi:hypothetical protein